MPRVRCLVLFLSLSIAAGAACTKTVRVVEPLEYHTALTDSTRTFEILTRDHILFVSKRAHVDGDSVVVVTRGHQVQETPWRQKKAPSVPIYIPIQNIERISESELDRGSSFVFAVTIFLVVFTIIGLHSIHID